jgi:hypothetical protein
MQQCLRNTRCFAIHEGGDLQACRFLAITLRKPETRMFPRAITHNNDCPPHKPAGKTRSCTVWSTPNAAPRASLGEICQQSGPNFNARNIARSRFQIVVQCESRTDLQRDLHLQEDATVVIVRRRVRFHRIQETTLKTAEDFKVLL